MHARAAVGTGRPSPRRRPPRACSPAAAAAMPPASTRRRGQCRPRPDRRWGLEPAAGAAGRRRPGRRAAGSASAGEGPPDMVGPGGRAHIFLCFPKFFAVCWHTRRMCFASTLNLFCRGSDVHTANSLSPDKRHTAKVAFADICLPCGFCRVLHTAKSLPWVKWALPCAKGTRRTSCLL